MTYYYYRKGKCVRKTNVQDNVLKRDHVEERSIDDQRYHEDLVSYKQYDRQFEQKFIDWLYYDLEIQDNPKRDRLYSIAYDRGHSCGYNEIYINACDLVDLIT